MATTAPENKPEHQNPSRLHNEDASDVEKRDSASDHDATHAINDHPGPETEEDRKHFELYGTYDRYEISEEQAWDELGFSFPTWKKWLILSVVFLVQVSMNFNTSLYSNGLNGISEEFGVSLQAARVGAAVFLVTYAFGCEIFAPWSVLNAVPIYYVRTLLIIYSPV